MRSLCTLIFTCLLSCFLFITSALAEDYIIAAAGGYRKPFTALTAAFEQKTGIKIPQVYGHMGQIIAQAYENKDIAFVCGDQTVLEKAKNIHFSQMVKLGEGKLVIAYRKGMAIKDAAMLQDATMKTVAMPDPKSTIYGLAAQQYMERSGLIEAIKPKIITVSSVPQVTSYLVSGDADTGFINITDALGAGDNIGGFIKLDSAYYDRIIISCGVVAQDGKQDDIQAFINFLQSTDAQNILTQYGL